jgi:hypothetical protein
MATPEIPRLGASPRFRRALPLAVVGLASLVAVLAILAAWANRQLFETDSWVETSTALLEREEIRDALASYLVSELYIHVDVEGEIAAVLPKPVKPLAGPAAGGLRQGAEEIARRALDEPRLQALWADANREAHELLIEVLEGGGETVSTEEGAVVLDLTTILERVADRTGIPGDVAEQLPPEAASLEILRSDQLAAAQDGAHLLHTLAWVLGVLTLLLYALAVFLGGERRREVLRAVGFSFVAVGAFVLIVRGYAGGVVVDELTASAADEPAVAATWEIGTSLLSEAAGAAILYGIAIVVAAWIAGPTAIATATRGFLAPYLRQPRFAFGGLFVLVVLLFWWSPTPATERLVPALVLIAALTLGVEMLRRRTIAEFPERVTTFSAAGLAQTMAQQTRESMARRVRARAEAQEAAATGARLEALERVARLHDSGVLTDDEFQSEKARLLVAGSG